MATKTTTLAALVLLLSLSSSDSAPTPPAADNGEPLRIHGQAPFPLNEPIAVSSSDRIFVSAQTSNGVSVVDPFDAKLLGVLPLGGRLPETLGALYRGQSIVHGSGFSPDRKTVAAVCVGSDAVAFLDATGEKDYGVINITNVGRSPHEASWSPSGDEVWVAVRGQNFVEILDGRPPFESLAKVVVPDGPGMVAFSPDGKLAFVCSSFTPETVVIDTSTREIVASIEQLSTFCPNLAVTPDGAQLWFTLKNSGEVQVVEAKEPFRTIAVLDTGSVTNHVNFAVLPTKKENDGENNATTTPTTLAFVSVGGERKILVFSTANVSFGSPPPKLLKTIQIPNGDEPHAVWPSGDGTRIWVGLQVSNAVVAVDTEKLEVVDGSRVEIGGQSPMGMVYVPGAASASGNGSAKKKTKAKASSSSSSSSEEETKQPAFLLADAAREQNKAFHFELVSPARANMNDNKTNNDVVLTSVVVNQQATFVDALEAVASGLRPGEGYALCLTAGEEKKGSGGKGEKSSLSSSSACENVIVELKGGKDGAASIATVGPFTDLLFEKNKGKDGKLEQKRFFVVVSKKKEGFGSAVQVQRQ